MNWSKAFVLIFLMGVLSNNTYSNTYYFSSSTGSDNFTVPQAQNSTTPWKTLGKLNSFLKNLKAGDSVLFKRGDIFYGGIRLTTSGTVGNALVFGAYGDGIKPLITGFNLVNNWINLGSNIWESVDTVSTLSSVNIVLINGVNTPMGQFPKRGWNTISSSSATSITDSSLGAIDWTGAKVVIRKEHWIVEKSNINSQSGSTINFTKGLEANPRTGWGYFIQDHLSTLTKPNDWYFDPTTKKLKIYSLNEPEKVEVPTIDILVYARDYGNYTTYENLSFSGGNIHAFFFGYINSPNVNNCDINYIGQDAVYSTNVPNIILNKNNINHINGNGISLLDGSDNSIVKNNSVKNSGLLVGLTNYWSRGAISSDGSNSLIQYNEIENSGYNGIMFFGLNAQVKNNFIANSCMVKDDGGGIYTSGGVHNTNGIISNNIVLNTLGNSEGTGGNSTQAVGIYLDDNSKNIEVAYNTAAGCNDTGVYLHNTNGINLHHNIAYNNQSEQFLIQAEYNTTRDNIVNNNIFVAKTPLQLTGSFKAVQTDIPLFGKFENNCYSRPIDDSLTIETLTDNWTKYNTHTLSQWKSYSGLDISSMKSSLSITNSNEFRFEYNATNAVKTISLDKVYVDAKNNEYQLKLTLQPYTSVVLVATNKIPEKTIQTIIIPVILAKTFGDAPFALTATASSNLPVSFKIISGPATIKGNLVTVTGSGTAVIEASQAGDEKYQPAAAIEETFKVSKANQSISFASVPAKKYGDLPLVLDATSSSGLTINFKVISGPGTILNNLLSLTGPGAIYIEASQAGNENYNPAIAVTRILEVKGNENVMGAPLVENPAEVKNPLQIYPNPFSSKTTVQFRSKLTEEANLRVYNVEGKLVRSLFSGKVIAGELNTFIFDGEELTAGVYYVRLTTSSTSLYQKVLLTK